MQYQSINTTLMIIVHEVAVRAIAGITLVDGVVLVDIVNQLAVGIDVVAESRGIGAIPLDLKMLADIVDVDGRSARDTLLLDPGTVWTIDKRRAVGAVFDLLWLVEGIPDHRVFASAVTR